VAPDLDKLVRAVLDALTAVAYRDDGQVTRITATKEYGTPGLSVSVGAKLPKNLA
jgi:Holliday junction resolvase RusA-like endonuclease